MDDQLLGADLSDHRFSAEILKPLDHVDLSDLKELLNEFLGASNPSLAADLARLIHKKTKGVYADTLRELEWGCDHDWPALHRRLNDRQETSLPKVM